MSNLVSVKDDTISPNNADLQSDLPVGKKKYKYPVIANNPALNNIARLNSKANRRKRPAGGGYEVKYDTVTAIIKYAQLGERETQMFTYINWNFINNDQNQSFILTMDQMIADFKYLQGRPRRSAYRTIKTTLDKLSTMSISYNGGYTPKDSHDTHKLYDRNFNSGNHQLFEYDYQKRAGIFTITLSDLLYNLFLHAMIMPFFLQAFRLDPNKEGIAIAILMEVARNKKQNFGKPRADWMKFKTLLPKLNGKIPSKEGAHRHVQERIIDPLFSQIEKLAQGKYRTFDEYEIVDSNGKPADPKNYEELLECSLHVIKWHNYPAKVVEKIQEQQLQHQIDYQRKKVSVLKAKIKKLEVDPQNTTAKTICGMKEELEDMQKGVHTLRMNLKGMKEKHLKLENKRQKEQEEKSN